MDRNFEYMFYGFTAAWLVVMIYVISIALRERRLREGRRSPEHLGVRDGTVL